MPFRTVVTIDSPPLGGTGTNTWHMRTGPDVLPGDGGIEQLMENLEEFYTSIAFGFPAGTRIAWDGNAQGVGADEGTWVDGEGWEITSGPSGGSLPPANSVCVSWRGESGDRSRRGRTFIGPISLNYAEGDGTVSPTLLGPLRAAAAALIADNGGTLGAFGVWSRQESVLRDFVGASVRDQFAVLRSRRD